MSTNANSNEPACPICRSRVPCDCSTWRSIYIFIDKAAALLRTLPQKEPRHA